ncbi:MAG: hypothetical protein DCF16_15440 [Alphaproteobacteria bacterium]|nr:MAG: hypothetical protein DCF16_15440 [Alphaproteobacteria bacterium]
MATKESGGGLSIAHFSFIVFWLLLGSGLYGAIYYSWYIRLDDQLLLSALSATAWPFVLLVIGPPSFMLVAVYIDRLWAIKKSIDGAPEKIEEALAKVGEFEENVSLVADAAANKLSQALDVIQNKTDAVAARFEAQGERGEHAGAQAAAPTLREEVLRLVADITPQFYSLIEEWNSDKRRKDSRLNVVPGGGNRSLLAKTLGENGRFSRDPEVNALAQKYMTRAFDLEMGTRRWPVTPEQLSELTDLRAELEKKGWFTD